MTTTDFLAIIGILLNRKSLINSGRYSSASEVVGEGLRLLSDKERIRAKRYAELKEKIRIGIEASERGEVVDGEEVFAELEEDIRHLVFCLRRQKTAKEAALLNLGMICILRDSEVDSKKPDITGIQ